MAPLPPYGTTAATPKLVNVMSGGSPATSRICVNWYRGRTAEGWEFVALDFDDEEEVADYGTADWKAPRLRLSSRTS